MRIKDFDNAISCWLKVVDSSENNQDLVNIYYRLYDAYLHVNQFSCIPGVLDKITSLCGGANEKYFERLDLFNSKKSKKNIISVKPLNNFVKSHIDKKKLEQDWKSSDLEFFCMKFELAADVTDKIFYVEFEEDKRIQIIQPESIEKVNDKVIVEISFNLNNVKSCGLISYKTLDRLPLFSFDKRSIVNVLYGKNNFLFLDNDTNKSVSQYKGELLISQAELDNWSSYFDRLKQFNTHAIFLIAPSKEKVLPQFYPVQKGAVTPVDQLLSVISAKGINFTYPVSLLKNIPDSYVETETHWSYIGAMAVVQHVLEKLNINTKNVDFNNLFKFKKVKYTGDLGSKCNPIRHSNFAMLDSKEQFNFNFHNYIECKQGSLYKVVNDRSVFDKSIIVYGDSFSQYFIKLLSVLFRKSIFCRTNASIITSIVDYEKPDYLISEIAERFILKAPSFYNNIHDFPYCVRMDIANNSIESLCNYKGDDDFYNNYMNIYKSLCLNEIKSR